MTWLALTLFGIAIALWRHSRIQTDEISQVIELIAMLIFLMAGLAIAPLLLKTLSLALLLLYPSIPPIPKTASRTRDRPLRARSP